ncbi:phosphorylase [Leptospira sp. 2 VSF19]|uniref:Phosphorylase n=1 Tax=Leptospira soteropolitanensis TaxID=2950025 RepID=A0AAW5VHV6_9LEPT|nr:phosphorylase [Leptospira soteropolitanensis]MCW7492776.1 phosphorylase [Leptospira soteropolitanensis]MCW7500011.1 phosphorylase [Leptospira soteropolitanensis]MCW7522262.1 phosphorylase [Leptospira soteropolitanensis]MCW7526118.1 phosphorylase [Leptospira soteropolitanensis]MCW7529770.1 phosphorylase [Leptospira soteropolitanensis]
MLPFNKNKTLVTGAFEGEINLLRASDKFPYLEVMGIGNLEAAVQLSEYLSKNKEIRHIVFFGSCGVYDWSKIQVGSIISPNRVYTKELAHALKMAKQIPESPEFHELVPDKFFKTAKCNAPTTITLTELKQPPEESWKNLEVENLELFGIAKVATKFSITVTAYLAVTNSVGPNGSNEWAKNWKNLSESLQNQFLKAGKEIT